MFRKLLLFMAMTLFVALLSATPSDSIETAQASELQQTADLAAVKAYTLDNAQKMKAATAGLKITAERYYILMESYGFDYEAAFAQDGPLVAGLAQQARDQWIEASTFYELDEGIIAGVPSLAYYDIWIDAGPPAADAPDEALEWQLVLANGEVLESPGNFFHNITEPALYGTNQYTALMTDKDGDGNVVLGEALPDAEILLAAAQGLDIATAEMLTAVEGWEPTLEDTFGALVTMTPTMNEYFEQWKLSAFVAGQEDFEESGFVAVSRLFDIDLILNGLNFAYENISPVVAEADADLDAQIKAGYTDLVGFVGDLRGQEEGGKQFTPEEADLFGTEAQDKATALAGQVSQAAALVDVELVEEDPVIPDGPIVITAEAPDPLEIGLAAVKEYAAGNAFQMKAATAELQSTAERYYILIEAADFDYETAWEQNGPALAALVADAKEQWIEASTFYELDEGIIAGIPSLAFYDVWIDAGNPLADDPEGLEWTLELPDRTLDSPGNFFHNLLEPALYGTVDEYVGATVDLDGNGTVQLGEALPEANVLLGAAQGLDQATSDMVAAVEAWEPTPEDTFGALVTMVPTMNEYFEQWKLSAFVAGEDFEETAFIGLSRLFDITGILNGLDVAYSNISPIVRGADADADAQIKTGFSDLVTYVDDLYQRELDGTRFSAEEADLFGTEAQDRATALAGQVAQAAALVDVEIIEEDPVIPDGPIVITAEAPDPLEIGLAAVKEYAVGNAVQMKAATAELQSTAEEYYSLIASYDFDYEAAWAENGPALTALVADAKDQWIEASTFYELDEGIVAGVPSLAFYDVWIDAGAPLADDPEGLEWTLELPDRTLDSPGNFFHNLLEPALYGTVDEYVGAAVDLDGNGTVQLGEALPEANVLLGAAQGLDQATADLNSALAAWEPTPEDTFGALVTMVPTMNEYFEQWKLSAFVAGEDFEETAFIGLSRLFDITGILNGLDVAYDNISPVVSSADTDVDAQIQAGFSDLVTYVDDLYQRELDGTRFSAEEADLFGTEAQDRATALAGQVAQAAALVGVEITEEDPVIPTEPIVITAEAPGN